MKRKICKRCNEEKALNEFRKTKRGYYISYCDICEKIIKNEYWLKKKNEKYNNYKNNNVENLQNEIWKDITGYEGLYQVSSLGRIKSLTRFNEYYNAIHKIKTKRIQKEKILNYSKNNRGYLQVCLTKNGKSKTYIVHRLVAKAFLSNSKSKEQVNHIDGNKENNSIDNLEWVTSSENNKHAFITGLNKPHNMRKVNQYDLQGNFIKQWNSITDFLKENNLNLKNSNITTCCKGKRKNAYGFIWKYADEDCKNEIVLI